MFNNKAFGLFLFLSLMSYSGFAQKHILPQKIKEERQAIGAMENTNIQPMMFDFRTPNGKQKTNQIASAESTWLPGEFEESQSVVIGWGAYDADGNVDTTSNLAVISAQLCIGIQPEATVLIRINQPSDSFAIKRYMDDINQPLYNYRFIIKWGDDWWARDFGPIGYYQGEKDSLVLSDFKYYPGREHDNALNSTISSLYNAGQRITRMNYEGGNLIADGFGKVFYSSVVSDANSATGTHFPTLPASLVADSMKKVLQADQVVQLPALNCDGGTGHLDLYLKMMDEETWIAGQYPSVITASDKTLSESNVTLIKGMNSVYGRPYRVFRLPLPTDNNGSYTQQITCTNLNNAGRSFINGITVNKTFIYPIWDSPGSGNLTQRNQVEANLKKWFPGMKLFGIDVRAMTGFGGQLHCITMQVPTDNPVKFWHPAFRDVQVIKPVYHLVSSIKNKSGIATAICKWRKGRNGTWTIINLTDSSGFFIGDIVSTGFANGDTIQYFLQANTNNGKTAFKPITAPEGYFEFVVSGVTGLYSMYDEQNPLISLYPNPGEGLINISTQFRNDLEVKILNTSGKEVYRKSLSKRQGSSEYSIQIDGFSPGLYLVAFFSEGKKVWTSKYTKN
jgi:agmatine deiminase